MDSTDSKTAQDITQKLEHMNKQDEEQKLEEPN
jgi:hypothetical protein